MDQGVSKSENENFDLEKLREMARIAGIYHRDITEFQRNRNLSYLVHISLHLFQFIIALAIEIFHHAHHQANRNHRKKDPSYPFLPEEGNPIFAIYPLCMLMSLVFAAVWKFTNYFMKDPKIVLVGCFAAAALMLIVGIVEMKHADMYLDLTKLADDQLLKHPVFVHNFVMCLISIFCMCMYLVQGWMLFDYYFWVKKQADRIIAPETEIRSITETQKGRQYEREIKEAPGELDPIPVLEAFPSLTASETLSVDKEEIIFYCCFIDCYNYLKQKQEIEKPFHEFQVIHVM